MGAIDLKEIAAARRRIAPHVRRTPVLALEAGALRGLEQPVALELELLQRTGSFELRPPRPPPRPRVTFRRRVRENFAAGVPGTGAGIRNLIR